MLLESVLSDTGMGLARADHDIAQAERNIRHVKTLIAKAAMQGFPTVEVESQLKAMTQMLANLKSQRWEIEGLLDEPYVALNG
jgi:protein-disulfide isomerase-like protein with CxxC motif